MYLYMENDIDQQLKYDKDGWNDMDFEIQCSMNVTNTSHITSIKLQLKLKLKLKLKHYITLQRITRHEMT